MNNIKIDENELKDLFSAIGLSNVNGEHYRERLKKHQQIYEFINHLNKAVGKLSQKRKLILLDCGCGKSYLSFIANYYLTRIEKRYVDFICIDYNPHVIKVSKEAAKTLAFDNMTFICDDIFNVAFSTKPDIVYSLHACDIATDMTIAKGILEEAKYIMTVSCCQHRVRHEMKRHPLGAITKHGIYKERLVDMVADSMRTLLLESRGYKVSVFEYVSTKDTPKNVMVRAVKTGTLSERKAQKAITDYTGLKEMFNVEPMLHRYIQL